MGDGIVYKGEVATYADLAGIVDPQTGWEYYVTADAAFYVYNGASWDQIDNGIVQTITDGDTAHAPSGDAVYDALASEASARTAADSNLKSAIQGNSQRIENLEVAVSGSLVQTNVLTDPPSMANVRTITSANEILPWAILKRVGARAVAWNQLVSNGNFENTTGWNAKNSAILSASSNELTINATNQFSGANQNIDGVIVGHTYLAIADVKSTSINTYAIMFFGSTYRQVFVSSANKYEHMVFTLTVQSLTSNRFIGFENNVAESVTINVKNVNIFDLTAMGLDTLSADQFKAKFPASYYPYNAGEIIPLNPSAFKVVGKNKNNNANNNIGSYWTTSGVAYASGYASTERIKCVPLGTYIGSLFNKTTNARVANVVYTTFNSLDDTKALRQVTDATITLVAGENYISIRNYGDNSAYITADNFLFQLEIGSTASAYGLYTETTIDTSFTSDYLYVNENCHDYSENVLVNGVMRREEHLIVGSITYDGSSDENWVSGGQVSNFYIQLNTLMKASSYIGKILCDRLETVSSNFSQTSGAGIMSISGYSDSGSYPSQNWLYAKITESITTTSELKTWLAQNPITVNFALATPSTTTLHDPIPNIPCEDGTTITAVTPQTDLVNAIDVPSTIAYMTKIGG